MRPHLPEAAHLTLHRWFLPSPIRAPICLDQHVKKKNRPTGLNQGRNQTKASAGSRPHPQGLSPERELLENILRRSIHTVSDVVYQQQAAGIFWRPTPAITSHKHIWPAIFCTYWLFVYMKACSCKMSLQLAAKHWKKQDTIHPY